MNTTYFLNLVADNVFRKDTSPAIPTTYYVGLSTTTPAEDGTGVTEPTKAAGYKRVAASNLSPAVDGLVTNSSAISFDEPTANWGTITHFMIFDAPSGGKLLMFGELSPHRTIEDSTTMTIKKGAIELSVCNLVT